jgi:hypothetical protein
MTLDDGASAARVLTQARERKIAQQMKWRLPDKDLHEAAPVALPWLQTKKKNPKHTPTRSRTQYAKSYWYHTAIHSIHVDAWYSTAICMRLLERSRSAKQRSAALLPLLTWPTWMKIQRWLKIASPSQNERDRCNSDLAALGFPKNKSVTPRQGDELCLRPNRNAWTQPNSKWEKMQHCKKMHVNAHILY